MQVRNYRFVSDDSGHFRCPICLIVFGLGDFRDPLSVKEHGISGLCQSCQDEVFAEPPLDA